MFSEHIKSKERAKILITFNSMQMNMKFGIKKTAEKGTFNVSN